MSKKDSVEAQLRHELAQVTAALEETDIALDEWIAETERLQELIKSKEKDSEALVGQMDELKQHSLKLLEVSVLISKDQISYF
jgi:hypothetical protein